MNNNIVVHLATLATADEYLAMILAMLCIFFRKQMREFYISLRWLFFCPTIVIEWVSSFDGFPVSILKKLPFILDPVIPLLVLILFKMLHIACRAFGRQLGIRQHPNGSVVILERSMIFFLIVVVAPIGTSFILSYLGIVECGIVTYHINALFAYWALSTISAPSFLKTLFYLMFMVGIRYNPYYCPVFKKVIFPRVSPRLFMLPADGKMPLSGQTRKKYIEPRILPEKAFPRYVSGITHRCHLIILLPGSRESIFSPLMLAKDTMLKELWEKLPSGFVDVPGTFTGTSSEEAQLPEYWKWKKNVDEAIAQHRQFVINKLTHYSEQQQRELGSYLEQMGLSRIEDPSSLNVEYISTQRNIFVSSWSTNAIFCFNVDYNQGMLSQFSKIKDCNILVEPVVRSFDPQREDLSRTSHSESGYATSACDQDKTLFFYSEYPGRGTKSTIQSMVRKDVLIPSNLYYWGFDEAWKWSTGWDVVCSFYDTGASMLPNGIFETFRGRWPGGKLNGPSTTIEYQHSWHDFIGESSHWPSDLEMHGTAVISSFCGASEVDNLITGVAPDALWIMFDGLSEISSLAFSQIVDNLYSAIRFAEWSVAPGGSPSHGVRITSASLAAHVSFAMDSKETLFYAELHECIHAMLDACCVTSFIASGNSGDCFSFVTSFAQSSRQVITVGSAFFDDTLDVYLPSFWSSHGSMWDLISSKVSPDFLAPGHNIVVSNAYSIPGNGAKLHFVNGTSFASPSAAGVTALLLAIDPTLKNREIYEIFKITAIRPFSFDDSFSKKKPALLKVKTFSHILETTEKYLFDVIAINPVTKRAYLKYPNIFYGQGVINATAAVLFTRELLNTRKRVQLG